MVNLGTHYLQLPSEMKDRVLGLSPKPVGSALSSVSVRDGLNCRTPGWSWKIGQCEKKSSLLVTKVFCVSDLHYYKTMVVKIECYRTRIDILTNRIN